MSSVALTTTIIAATTYMVAVATLTVAEHYYVERRDFWRLHTRQLPPDDAWHHIAENNWRFYERRVDAVQRVRRCVVPWGGG